jgi:hypothetical protein
MAQVTGRGPGRPPRQRRRSDQMRPGSARLSAEPRVRVGRRAPAGLRPVSVAAAAAGTRTLRTRTGAAAAGRQPPSVKARFIVITDSLALALALAGFLESESPATRTVLCQPEWHHCGTDSGLSAPGPACRRVGTT